MIPYRGAEQLESEDILELKKGQELCRFGTGVDLTGLH